ncbi:MAG: sigma-54 dependent transcriptional regulator [Planctomycetota bacterium]|nr:sigma-54 dependent transcriptional regulator [Planctomycetota bacterium]
MDLSASKPIALIVDDEKSICDSLSGVLSDEGWRSVVALSGKEGIKKFVQERPDIVLLDVWMTGMDGIETLQKIKELRREIPVVIMSGHGSIETAVKATKLGAFDYLEKPLSLDKLLPMLEHANEMKQQRNLQDQAGPGKHELIGSSASIELVRKQIRLVAPKNSWVLITGENGTGKEVVAQQIHLESSRAKYPFVAINCAAIPEELIESELFGHEKGAFTNALGRKKGKFEIAHKGTLFLDEIGDMSLKTQAKILRILQEQQFERVGGSGESINVDVRVIAATNKDLEAEIKAGRFREDLYYRLNVILFHLQPLREREDDAVILAKVFLQQICARVGDAPKQFSEDVLTAFRCYSWPGNVRELHNIVERLCIMVDGSEIGFVDLPDHLQKAVGAERPSRLSNAATLREARSDFERAFILKKLEESDWNISKTAEAIGIERSNLHRKLRAYDIDLKQLKG